MIRRVAAIAGAVFADAVRRRVVHVVVFFAAVMALAIPALPSYGLGVAPALFREISQALIFSAAAVVTLALAANRVAGEVERRTVYAVLARPVARWEYLAGTWAGIFAVMGVVIGGFTVVEQAVGLWRYGSAMWVLWEGSLAIWLEMGVVAALATALSAATGPVAVTLASLTFLFAGHSRSQVVGEGAGWAARALYPSLDAFNVINAVAHGSGIDLAYGAGMFLAFAGWVAGLLLAGALVFGRRDL